MKIEIGLDDRTVLSLDKLTHALQQLVRPECHYYGANAPTNTPTPAAPTPVVPTPTPPAPVPTPVPVQPPTPAQPVNDPFAVGAPGPSYRAVSDDELRGAMQAVLTQPGGKEAVSGLLAKKYKVNMVRDLDSSRRYELIDDLAKGIPGIVAVVGAA